MNARLAAYLTSTAPLVAQAVQAPSTLPGQIAEDLRRRIQAGEFQPGDPLRETPLADGFGCSRGPVREALKMLAREGLVDQRQGAGAVVASMGREDLVRHFRLRAEVAGLFVALAAERLSRPPALTDAILEGAEVLAAVAADAEAPVGDYIAARRRLTELIGTLAAAPYVANLSRQLEREIAVLWTPMLPKARQRRSAAIWRKVAREIARGDSQAAEAEARRLVLEALDELVRVTAS